MINRTISIYAERFAATLTFGTNIKQIILNACLDVMTMAAGLLCAVLATLIIGL
jgi:hypothetical protein